MNGTFNGTQSTWTRDHARDEFYRQQNEQRRIAERAVRAEFWLAQHIEGQRFPTEDAMRAAVTEIALRHNQMDDEIATVIRWACAALWKTGRYTALAQVA